MNWIDRAGIFRGVPIEVGMEASERSPSIGLRIVMSVKECLNQQTNEWDDWDSYDVRASGTLWIIKKDGSINEMSAEMARDVLGWDGNLDAPDVGVLNPCQFSVNQEDYNGTARFKIGFLNQWDYVPGHKIIDPDRLVAIKNQHGSKLRAFFGQKSSGVKAPAGRPPSPPPVKAPQQTGVDENGLPF